MTKNKVFPWLFSHIWKEKFSLIIAQVSLYFSSEFFSSWLSSNQTMERKLLFKFFSFLIIFQGSNRSLRFSSGKNKDHLKDKEWKKGCKPTLLVESESLAGLDLHNETKILDVRITTNNILALTFSESFLRLLTANTSTMASWGWSSLGVYILHTKVWTRNPIK